jgi:hypothetical protein
MKIEKQINDYIGILPAAKHADMHKLHNMILL